MNVTEDEYLELLKRPGVKKPKTAQAPEPERKNLSITIRELIGMEWSLTQRKKQEGMMNLFFC